MKVKIKIDKDYEKPLCVIYTSEVSDEINECAKLLSQGAEQTLTGRSGEDIVIIKPDEITNIYTANGKVFAVTSRGEYSVNTRLYKLEETLNGRKFVRISNSEIVNLNEVKSFNLKISGTICVEFFNGKSTYVSRRYVSKIKERLGV